MSSKQLEHQEYKAEFNKFPLELLLHNISSPYNVGGLFRLADAMGISKLWISGDTPFPPNKKVHKTARSTEKYTPFESVDKPLLLLQDLKAKAYQIVCLEICDNSIPLKDLPIDPSQKICMVLGEESKGIHPDFLALADYICHIEMFGKNSSMNLVSATSIAAHTIITKLTK